MTTADPAASQAEAISMGSYCDAGHATVVSSRPSRQRLFVGANSGRLRRPVIVAVGSVVRTAWPLATNRRACRGREALAFDGTPLLISAWPH